MKILVLQLARLGDILQTWPTVRALAREGHQVDLLVRPRFRSAAEGLESVSKVHLFETRKYVEPVLSSTADGSGVREGMKELDTFFDGLCTENFDAVVNLSFSALSSWICFELEQRSKSPLVVMGYTRHSDGTFSIPDDPSAYFYAQVGVGQPNRIPLPHLFATIAGVALQSDDWRRPAFLAAAASSTGRSDGSKESPLGVVHIGASERHKSFSARDWVSLLGRALLKTQVRFVLVGAADEAETANAIVEGLSKYGGRIESTVGQTTFRDLWTIAARADVIVGGDSVLAQMAPLVDVPVLNISTQTVSHWETGPLSKGSRIFAIGSNDLAGEPQLCDRLIDDLGSMLGGHPESTADRVVTGPVESLHEIPDGGEWSLVRAIYMGGSWPVRADLSPIWRAWRELADIEREQTGALLKGAGQAKTIAELLNQVDAITDGLAAESEWATILANWWKTERLRVPPCSIEETCRRFLEINQQLINALQNLLPEAGVIDDRQNVEL